MYSNDINSPEALVPLPRVLQKGLIPVALFGLLSLISAMTLLAFLVFRMIKWYSAGKVKKGFNQFMVLFMNLLLSDIQQALAFTLNLRALSHNGVTVHNTSCFAQGWFISTGDLASSIFNLALALHTFFAIIYGRKISNRLFYSIIGAIWTFTYGMAVITIGLYPKDLYVRAGAWVGHRLTCIEC